MQVSPLKFMLQNLNSGEFYRNIFQLESFQEQEKENYLFSNLKVIFGMCNQIFNPETPTGVKSQLVKVKDFFKDESIIRRKDIDRIYARVKTTNNNRELVDKIMHLEMLNVKDLIKYTNSHSTEIFDKDFCCQHVARKIQGLTHFWEGGSVDDVTKIVKKMHSLENDDEYFYLLINLMYRKIVKLVWKLQYYNEKLNFSTLHLEDKKIEESLYILIKDLQISDSSLESFAQDAEEQEYLNTISNFYSMLNGPKYKIENLLREFKKNGVDAATVLEVNQDHQKQFQDVLVENPEVEIFPETALDAGFREDSADQESKVMVIMTIQNKNRIQRIDATQCQMFANNLRLVKIATTFSKNEQILAQCVLSSISQEVRKKELETLLGRMEDSKNLFLCGYLAEDLKKIKTSLMINYLDKEYKFLIDQEVERSLTKSSHNAHYSSMISDLHKGGKKIHYTNDIIIGKSNSIKNENYTIIPTQTYDHNIIIAKLGN